jgi:ribosomal protein S18 acetylase RimI-like enzyme
MSLLTASGHRTVGGLSVSLRDQVHPSDIAGVRRITESTGFFSAAEIEVAVELVQARLSRGVLSGYYFVFADPDPPPGESLGYSCFGPIACTVSSFDLYWIAVQDRFRGIGLGTLLLAEGEAAIRRMGGRRVYVETSSRSQYNPTRIFYSRGGYRQEALIPDFYAPGDAKIIYLKELS